MPLPTKSHGSCSSLSCLLVRLYSTHLKKIFCFLCKSNKNVSSLCSSIGGDDIRSPGTVIWSQTLVHYSSYKKDDLVPIASAIATYVNLAEKSKYQAVRKKYSNQKFMKVSVRSELRSPSFLALCGVDQKKVVA